MTGSNSILYYVRVKIIYFISVVKVNNYTQDIYIEKYTFIDHSVASQNSY